MSFDWKSMVTTFAPTVATVLGTPLAGAGIKVLTEVLNMDNSSTEQDIENSVATNGITPEQLVALKTKDHELKTQLSKDGIDLVKLHNQGKEDARNYALSTGDTSTPRLIMILSFALFGFCLIGTFGLFLFIPMYVLPKNPTFVIPAGLEYLLGGLTSTAGLLCKSAVDYYLGSSTGSEAKNELLYKSTPVSSGPIASQPNIVHPTPEYTRPPTSVTKPVQPTTKPTVTQPAVTTPEQSTSKYPSSGAVFPPPNPYAPNDPEPEPDGTDMAPEDPSLEPEVVFPDAELTEPTGVPTNNQYGRLDGYTAYKKHK